MSWRASVTEMREVGSSRSPATIDCVGQTMTQLGSSPFSTRWAQKLHLWAVDVSGFR